jgi:hypothetical protein
MSLIQTIEQLNTFPRHQEEEYEYTSDFLEWFYQYVYRQQGFEIHPILQAICQEPEYECIREQCKTLINFNNSKNLDNDTLTNKYDNMKKWIIDMINKYELESESESESK